MTQDSLRHGKGRTGLLLRLGLVLAAVCAMLLGVLIFGYKAGRHTSFSDTGPMVTHFEKLGHLCTLKLHVADILRAERNPGSWINYIKGAWIVRGDALVAIDMTKATIESKDMATRRAVIVLPPPRLMSPRVDHDRTETYDVQHGWFSANEADKTRDEAMKRAQQLVEQAAKRELDDPLCPARPQAEMLIKSFYDAVGWTVEIKWSDRLATTQKT
jgi:hypothetical protein